MTAEELADCATRAGAIALAHFRRVPAERKADRTLVTRADREVEAFLARELGASLADAGIVGEEGTVRPGNGPDLVVIDPIDGTAAFVAGLPTWCVCVGILRGTEPVAGVVRLPVADETYVAAGGEAWWNGSRLPRLGAAAAGDRFIVVDAKIHLRYRIGYRGKIRGFGSGAYHAALVARGAAECALLGQAHLWDIAGPAALLHAVGGRYEYLGGAPVELAALADGRRAPDELLAGSPEAIAALRSLLVTRDRAAETAGEGEA